VGIRFWLNPAFPVQSFNFFTVGLVYVVHMLYKVRHTGSTHCLLSLPAADLPLHTLALQALCHAQAHAQAHTQAHAQAQVATFYSRCGLSPLIMLCHMSNHCTPHTTYMCVEDSRYSPQTILLHLLLRKLQVLTQ
jgi:hypothetical protein